MESSERDAYRRVARWYDSIFGRLTAGLRGLGLAAKRARGERLGARPALPKEVTRRIVIERGEGRTF